MSLPSARPNCAGVHAPTKTELAANQKLAKKAKQKVAEDKRLAAIARRAANLAMGQERLISFVESKTTRQQPRQTYFILSWPK